MVVPPVAETLVEGHTVLALLEQAAPGATMPPAVRGELLTPAFIVSMPTGNPGRGLRWFNDQDVVNAPAPAMVGLAVLVRDGHVAGGATQVRYPCAGAVLLTNAGAPDPRLAFEQGSPTYAASYLVTDPNDRRWSVDRWVTSSGTSIWAAAILDNDAGRDVRDDGASSCAPVLDGAVAATTGDNGYAFPDGAGGRVRYNAYFALPMAALTVADLPKDHAAEGDARQADASACAGACPGGSDDREGNSHAFHFFASLMPLQFSSRADGATASCDAAPGADGGCHATRRVDVWFGRAPVPLLRSYVLIDTEGSASPS